MKKIAGTLMLMAMSVMPILAQQNNQRTPIIEVTGSAELDIIPDEIYVSVTLREYMQEKKKQPIDAIEKEFKQVIERLKIDPKQVALEGVYGSYDYDYKTNKRGEFLNAKTYIIKFGDLGKYNQLVMALDKKGIENVYIQRTGHSKMEEYRRQVKVEALKAAKAKADLMLAALNKKTGDVLLIRERDNNMGYPMPYLRSNMVMEAKAADGGGNEPVEMQKIKIRYEVEAHFLIL
ncbi:MAG: SIMPL domain-containing protein [Bacteroidota bacterium]